MVHVTDDAAHPHATVSVVVCAYTGARWPLLAAAIDSVERQTTPAHETIIVIDHNEALLDRARAAYPDAVVVASAHTRGLSGARNTGIERATGSVTAFLDDDAVAEPDWLAQLASVFEDATAVGAGGAVRPAWQESQPRWFPDEFLWVVGCAHSGMPQRREPVRNVIGANMAFPTATLRELGGFDSRVGRVGTLPAGCEETELCIRATRGSATGLIIYEPTAAVDHAVPPERATLHYFLTRCRAEGRSKAVVARLVGSGPGLAAERTYTRSTLPRGIGRGLRQALRGDPGGLLRAAAIIVGLAVTTLGYVEGRLARGDGA